MENNSNTYSHRDNGKFRLDIVTARIGVTMKLLRVMAVITVMAALLMTAPLYKAEGVGINAPSQDFSRELGLERYTPTVGSTSQQVLSPDQAMQPLDPVASDSTTILISVNKDGNGGGNNDSFNATMSSDAKFVAFQSYANDLVNGITEPIDTKSSTYPQIYLRNLSVNPAVTSQITLNKDDTAVGGAGASEFPTLSANGNAIGWRSCAPDLVAGGVATPCDDSHNYENSNNQIFLRNLTNNVTILVSKDKNGTPGDHASGWFRGPDPDAQKGSKYYYPGYHYTPLSLSSDGNLVVYQSTATNLVNGLPAYNPDKPVSRIFLFNVILNTTTLISNPSDDCSAESPQISGTGRYVVYSSCISLPGKTGVYQVYLVDRDSHGDGSWVPKISMVSIDMLNNTLPGDGNSLYPAISNDGSSISFRSSAANLDIGYINTSPNIFLANRATGQIGLVSRRGQASGNAEATISVLNSDGKFIAFASHASNLVPYDTNNYCPPPDNPSNCPDVFILDHSTPTTYRVTRVSVGLTTNITAPEANQGSYYPAISADGKWVAFDSSATNLTNLPVSGIANVYVHFRGYNPEPGENTPIIAVDKPSLAYGNKDTTPQTLTISNVGTANLSLNGENIFGTATIFMIDNDTCNGKSLVPNTDTCQITVSYHQYRPWGTNSGSVVIHSNDPANPTLPIPITGGVGMNIMLPLINRH